jgi:hypothetical protein
LRTLREFVTGDHAPVALAALVGLACLATMSGYTFPDTINFLAETPGIQPHARDFWRINPGYPMVLWLVSLVAVPAHRMFVLCALQQAAFVFLVFCVGAMLREAGRPLLGRIAGFATALYVPYAWLAQTAQQETLYITATGFAAWQIVRALHGARGRVELENDGRSTACPRSVALSAFLAGLAAGCSVALRSVGVAGLAVVLGAALWARPGGARPVRLPVPARLRLFGFTALGIVIALSLFAAKNVRQFGGSQLVCGTGIHLYGRIAVLEREIADTPEARRLRELAHEAGYDEIFFPNAGWRLQAAIGWERGYGMHEADRLLRVVATQTLLDDPVRTLRLTWNAAVSMTDFADPSRHLLWKGLRPEDFGIQQKEVVRNWGKDPLYTPMTAAWPSYRGVEGIEPWFTFLWWWGRASEVFRGPWTLPLLVLLSLWAVVRREAVMFVAAGLASAQILAAAIGDQPYPRYWEPCVWAYAVALLTVAEDAARLLASRRRSPQIP